MATNARVAQVAVELLTTRTPGILTAQVAEEITWLNAAVNIRVAQITVETLFRPPPLSLWCGNPPSALIGKPYNFQIPAAGGIPPYTFTITSGTLPPGLVLDPVTGIISGTPTGQGITCLVIIHFDETTHNDQGAAMNNFWESGLARAIGDLVPMMIRVGGTIMWVRGNGEALVTIWGPEHQNNATPQLLATQGVPAMLAPTPGISYMTRFDLHQIENFTMQIGTNSIDAWIEISAMQALWKPDLYNR